MVGAFLAGGVWFAKVGTARPKDADQGTFRVFASWRNLNPSCLCALY